MDPSSSSSIRSSRPIPERTLHQPHRLTVTSHDGPSTSSTITDTAALRASYTRRAELQRKAEKWADRMMETTLDRATFKRATKHIQAHLYREILHERHLNSLCSYPLCPNQPVRPYSAGKRFVISTINRTIREKEGNEEEGFCSRRCKVRSEWVERGLGEESVWLRGEKGEVELLEEIEEARAAKEGEFKEEGIGKPSKGRRSDQPISSASKVLPELMGEGAETTSPIPVSPTKEPASAKPEMPITSTPQVADLLSTLVIHERDTPPTAPIPPFLTDPIPIQQDIKPGPPIEKPSHDTSSAKRAPSSMLGSSNRLTTALLSASRQIGSLPQLAPDSDDEGDGEPREEDWEKDMGWGEDDEETRALFDDARLAREIMEGEGEGEGST